MNANIKNTLIFCGGFALLLVYFKRLTEFSYNHGFINGYFKASIKDVDSYLEAAKKDMESQNETK